MSIKEDNIEQVAIAGERERATSIEITYFAEEGRNEKRVVLTLSNPALPELVSEWRQKLAQGRYDSYTGAANEDDVSAAGCGLRENEIVPVLNAMIASWNSAMPCEPQYTKNFLYENAYRIAEVAADFMLGKELNALHLARYDIESVEAVPVEAVPQEENPFVLTRPAKHE